MMIVSKGWLLLNRYPKETQKYEEYTETVTREKIELALLKLTKSELQILKLVNRHKIINSVQISRYIYKEGTGIKKYANRYTAHKLKKLYELGCIDRFFPLAENSKGSDHTHIVLGPVGARVLKIEKFRRFKVLHQNWRHTVFMSEILSNLYIKFEFIKWRSELKLDWKDEATRVSNLQPDIFIEFIIHNQKRFAFIEADMGTETKTTLVHKANKYIEYSQTTDFKRAYWQPYKKEHIAILPEVWFIMKYKKDAILLKNRLNTITSDIVFKVIWINDIKGTI